MSLRQVAQLGSPPAVGAQLGGRERRVTAADVALFAELTGDGHPLHRDSEAARQSAWGEPVAPGLLVLAFAVGLVDLDLARVLALRRLREVAFLRATRIGETIHVDARVLSTRPVRAGVELLGMRWVVRDASESVLVRAELELLWNSA